MPDVPVGTARTGRPEGKRRLRKGALPRLCSAERAGRTGIAGTAVMETTETADAEVNTGAKAATAADVAIAAGAAVRMMRRPARKSRAMPLRRAARIPNMDDPGLSSGLQAGRIAESGEVRRSKGGAAEALDAGEWKKRQNCGRESRKADGGNLSACPCADVRIGACEK